MFLLVCCDFYRPPRLGSRSLGVLPAIPLETDAVLPATERLLGEAEAEAAKERVCFNRFADL